VEGLDNSVSDLSAGLFLWFEINILRLITI